MQILIILFIPATVGLMTSVETVKAMLLPILVSVIVLTTLVLLISGHVTQWVIKRKKGVQEDEKK